MSLVYSQLNGALYNDGQYIGTGYSGFGPGKNNPDLEQVADTGPLPRGQWAIDGEPYKSDKLGPFVMNLIPLAGTNTYGRSEFRIHGDSRTTPGQASHGCLVFSHFIRQFIWASGLRVIVCVREVMDMDKTPPEGIDVNQLPPEGEEDV